MQIKTKGFFLFGTLVILYTALQVVPYHKEKKDSFFKNEDRDAPLIIAHGGAKELYPENTVLAYEKVMKMNIDVLEVDVCLTKDNILITHHDLTIDDSTNAKGNVSDYTYEELLHFNFGYHFSSMNTYPYRNESDQSILEQLVPMKLEDMLQRFGNRIAYIIEIKNQGEDGKKVSDLLNALIVAYDLQDRVCVASFHHDVLQYFNSIKEDSIITIMDYREAKSFTIANLLGYGIFMNYEASGISLPLERRNIQLDHRYLIYKAHKNDMFIYYWTINNKRDMVNLIEKGVDGIITDRPDLLHTVIEELKGK